MSNTIIDTDILIIGGGPSGMIASIALSKLGVQNIIVERKIKPINHPKAHELSARSIEILDSLGISLEEMLNEASDHETASRILFCNSINEEIGRIDLTENGTDEKYKQHIRFSRPYLNISQPELEGIIKTHLDAEVCSKFLQGHQWQSYIIENGIVNSEVLRIEDQAPITIRSKYVVCADGAGSRAREALGIRMNGPEKIQDFANAYITNDLSKYVKTKAKLYWIFNPDAPGVFIAHHPQKRWVYHVPVETPYEKIEDFTEEYFKKRVKIALGLEQDIDIHITSISSWRMTAQVAEKFRKDFFFLIGDAAHRFPPTGGLGMNSGIADAYNLCWKLKSVLFEEAGDELLDSYEIERKPVIERNCEESKKNSEDIMNVPREMGLNPDNPKRIIKIMRNPIIRLIPRDFLEKAKSFFKKIVTKRMQRIISRNKNQIGLTIGEQIGHFDRIGLDLGFTYNQGAFVLDTSFKKKLNDRVREYIPSTRPGERFPHFYFQNGVDQISSHELLSYDRFTFILGSEDSHWKEIINSCEWRINIAVFTLFNLKMLDEEYSKLLKLTEIESTGIILIRPDGQVAWRKKKLTLNEDPLQILKEAFTTIMKKDKVFISKTVLSGVQK